MFYDSWPCSSVPFSPLVERLSRTSLLTESPVMPEWVMGSFLRSLGLPTDRMFNNCCNSAGCWHCSRVSAELKHPEVYFSYFIWVYSYNHKGNIFILGQYWLYWKRLWSIQRGPAWEALGADPHRAGGAVARAADRWPGWAQWGQVHCEFSLAAVWKVPTAVTPRLRISSVKLRQRSERFQGPSIEGGR